jgi:anthranilate synthase component 1
MKVTLEEVKKYKDYDIVPVYDEIFSDFTTPLNALRNIKEISDRFYLLESVDTSKFS